MTRSSVLALLGACALAPVESDAPRPVIVEAESFASVEGEARPRVADFTWASGRAALVRFPGAEAVSWRLPAGEGDERELWLRYAASREVRLEWRSDEGEWRAASVPSTGGFRGRDAWRWARVGSVGAAASTLTVRGAPLRPDCFALTPAGSDEPSWPPPPVATVLDEDAAKRLADDPPRREPTWLERSSALPLPTWLEATRTGLHTRLSRAWTGTDAFVQAEEAAASLGAPALVRHVKTLHGECFWPSRQGAVAPWVEAATSDGVDPVRAMARRAHERGLAFVAYLRHAEDRPLADEHPDWTSRDHAGRVIRRSGEPRLCFHSPYAETVLGRLVELVDRGADAVYLDESHQPLEGCWCRWTRAAFFAETGLPLPAAPLSEDPLYRRFLAFTEDSLVETIAGWSSRLRELDPDFTLLVSTFRQPGLLEPLPTLRLAGVVDLVKTELRRGAEPELLNFLQANPDLESPSLDSLLTLGWALSRDGCHGRPAHVWIHDLEGAERWAAAGAAVVASGCVANLDHPEASLPDRETYGTALGVARAMGSLLAGARPLETVLLHVPERAKNALLPDRRAAWSRVLAPLHRAWAALLAADLPARLLSDDLLERGLPDRTRVLFLPDAGALEPRQLAAVEEFRARGGQVVEGSVEALVDAARGCALPVRLDVLPPGLVAHWFEVGDDTVSVGISRAPGSLLDDAPLGPAPPRGAVLSFAEAPRRVRLVRDGGDVETLGLAGADGLALPTFRYGAVVRIELR